MIQPKTRQYDIIYLPASSQLSPLNVKTETKRPVIDSVPGNDSPNEVADTNSKP